MLYRVTPGDSPQIIARTYGIPFDALINANPHKATTVVSDPSGRPVRTWQSLKHGEKIEVPLSGTVGDAAADALSALSSVNPCSAANVSLVCAAQRALGFTVGAGVDGKWGNDDSTRATSRGWTIAACSPRPAWWTPKGQSNCPSTTTSAPSTGSNLSTIANTALAALRADSNYCASVKRPGTPVNSAIHNFKAAWNAANPTNPVPINTGNYEPIVQIALALALNTPQENVPAGCGATAAPSPAPSPAPTPTPSSAPAAVQALVGIDPCLQANSGVVYSAQTALGIKADGKYGTGTASAARTLVPNAPAGCSPAPLWWGAKGTAQAAQATQTAQAKAAATGGTGTASQDAQAKAAAAAAAAQAADAAAKAAQASTKAQADQAAADAKAAQDAAARAAAKATTQAQADAAAAAAKAAADAAAAAAAKGGTTPDQGGLVTPEKKKISTGAIVAGAIGALALVGIVAVAATGGKGARGARGAHGSRGKRGKRGARKKSAHKSSRKRRK